MGTLQFDAKFAGMRKEQNFLVYPMNEKSNIIFCQSESRWLEINSETGECEITSSASGHHNRWLLVMQRSQGKSRKFTLPNVELQHLKMQIFLTAGKSVGNKVITTDNSGAKEII